MNPLIGFIKKPQNQRWVLLGLLIVLGLFFFQRCKETKSEEMVMGQNIASLSDSLRVVKTKNGEIEYAKKLLIADKATLKKLNDSLYKELIKEHGEIQYITIVHTVFVHDTIYVPTTVYTYPPNSDYDYSLQWGYKEKGDGWSKVLSGQTDFCWDSLNKKPIKPRTVINEDFLSVKMVTGFRYINGKYETFIRSSFPNATFDIESAIVNEEMITKLQKKWHAGILFGFGGAGYLNKFEFVDSPTYFIGLGITFTPFDWLNF